jgi:choline dehydrogenase
MQKWADEVGDQSYTFANMLPFFKKSGHYTPPDQTAYPDMSNTQTVDAFTPAGGPLEISFGNHVDPFGAYARKAYIALGMDQIDGFNNGKLLGSAYATSTIDPRNAHRVSSESSFLQAALNSGANLVVYKNTLGQKILFNSDKVATGVLVSTGATFGTESVNFTLNARKEVIVTAGVFQSAQLLMVSGIGPCNEFSKFGIPCISHLSGVGKNLQDHVMFGSARRVNVPTASAGINNATLAAQLVQQYLQDASGPLSIFSSSYYGWEKLPEPYRCQLSNQSIQALTAIPTDWPELEWLTIGAYLGNGFNRQTADPMDGHNYATISTALIAPQSRGTVSLAGPDMNTLPIIDPQWLVDTTDIELAIQGFKRGREVWVKLVELGVADPVEYFPGTNVTTDEQIYEFISQTSTSVYHASSTCKMGQKDDPMAVLDSSARVYGVQGLRVVDASSFPFLPPGHPQSVVYALAEKIADEILSTREQ